MQLLLYEQERERSRADPAPPECQEEVRKDPSTNLLPVPEEHAVQRTLPTCSPVLFSPLRRKQKAFELLVDSITPSSFLLHRHYSSFHLWRLNNIGLDGS